ncbi:MAG: rhodanese-like domain-containing protein [Chitinophagales bacterium]
MRFFYTIIFGLLLVACQSNTAAQTEDNTIISERVTVAEFSAKMEELDNEILLDVRTAKEIEMYGKIEGAIHFDFYEDGFNDKVAELDATKPILVYCWSGGRSADAAQVLLDNGFTEIYDLADGFEAWLDENEQ